MTEVIHGKVHQGVIKPLSALSDDDDVLIIRVLKPVPSKIEMIIKKTKELQDHSFVEEIIESTESGEGID